MNDTPKNQPVWDIMTTHPEMVEHFKNRWREVRDPEIGLDVSALGMIRNVTIQDGQASIYMILTTPYCPYGPAMLEMTRKQAEVALEMPVSIELGLEMWDFNMMEDGAMPEWGMW